MRDRIKEVLDRECHYRPEYGICQHLDGTFPNLMRDDDVGCRFCHKHDDLAARIADAITQEAK